MGELARAQDGPCKPKVFGSSVEKVFEPGSHILGSRWQALWR